MVLKYFLLGNPVSLCMKIINSVVVVGLYYGFLTTFSIGPSYLFLLRARVLEEEEGTEKLVSATTGFIMGQLMMFISIYYAPLHLALDRPHTITVLALLYLLFHFFWDEEIDNFEYTNRNRNSIRNFSIRRVFLNNLIFQLFNQFLLPSSTLARLVNVSMFRCNNKMLFVTSSFVGWLIGHILFMKWVGLVLFWIRKMNSIRWNNRSNKYILFCKYYASELLIELKSTDQLFVIILLITNIYYLGRIPSPALTRKRPDLFEFIEWEQKKKLNQNYFFWFEKDIVDILFDYKQWNRPLRHIKNDNFENPVIDEMSQYFFRICPGYGKQIISLTFPPSLSTFWKMMQRKFRYFPPSKRKQRPWDLYRDLVYINGEKTYHMRRELIARIRALGRGAPVLDVLEKRTRLWDNENGQKYLPKAYDPFLSGPHRQKKSGHKSAPQYWLNPILMSILIVDFPELYDKKNKELALKVLGRNMDTSGVSDNNQNLKTNLRRSRGIREKTIRTEVSRWSHFMDADLQEAETEMGYEPTEDYPVLLRKYKSLVIYSEDDQKDQKTDTDRRIGIDGQPEPGERQDKEIALLYYKRETDPYRGLIQGSTRAQRRKAVFLGLYQPNIQSPLFLDRTDKILFFSFEISKKIKNIFGKRAGKGPKYEVSTSYSERKKYPERKRYAERKKSVEREMQYLLEKKDISRQYTEKMVAERAIGFLSTLFDAMIAAGFEDVVLLMQTSRSLALLAQSTFRKYILLPSMIIAKNLVRMLFLQTPEWSADWRDWKKEIHIICTYNGIEISESEFPKDWLMEGIQIKVLLPFYPEPWRRSKLRSRHRDPMKEKKRNADWENQRKRKRKKKLRRSFYLTIWGGASNTPFGVGRKEPSFFQPIWKELKKRIRKEKKKPFSARIRALKERFRFLQTILGILKDKTRWIQNQKITPFIKKIKEFAKKNPIFRKRKPNREIQRRVFQLQMPQKQTHIRILPSRSRRGGVRVHKRTVPRYYNRYNNRTAFQYNPPATATNLTHSQIPKRVTKMYINKGEIEDEIRKLQEELLNLHLTPDGNISETGLDAEKLEIWLSIWEILSGIGARLKHKLRLIIKYLFIERIYMDIFLCTIIHAQLFFESKINEYIENIEKRIDETNKKKAIDSFISTLKESHSNISNEKSQTSRDLSSLSQAYVFYNLSQTQAINKYHLGSLLQAVSLLQDRGEHIFWKDRVKDYLRTLGILDAKSSPKRLPNSRMNKWINWLRGHDQYNLSQTRWSRLVPQKRRNKVSKRRTSQKKKSKKDSYEKDQPIHWEKQKNSVMNSLPIQKFKKNYRYDLLSHEYIYYEDKKDPYSYILSDYPGDLSDYLGEKSIMNIHIKDQNIQKVGRKYLDWRIIHNFIRENIDIKTGTKMKKNTKTGTGTKMKKKTNQKNFFDWMGMNEQKRYRLILTPNQKRKIKKKIKKIKKKNIKKIKKERKKIEVKNEKPWFFSELKLPYIAYKKNPRIIPIELLFLNSEGISEVERDSLRDFLIEKIENPKEPGKIHFVLSHESRSETQEEFLRRFEALSETQKESLRKLFENQKRKEEPGQEEKEEPGQEEKEEPGKEEKEEPGKKEKEEPGKKEKEEPGKKDLVATFEALSEIQKESLRQLFDPLFENQKRKKKPGKKGKEEPGKKGKEEPGKKGKEEPGKKNLVDNQEEKEEPGKKNLVDNQEEKEEPGKKEKEEPGKKEKEKPGQKNLGSDPQNRQKDLEEEEGPEESASQKRRRELLMLVKEAPINVFLRKHLLSQVYFISDLTESESLITNIRTYCVLLKTMKNSSDFALLLYFLRVGDVSADTMEDLRHSIDPRLNVSELIERGILGLDPIRLFRILDGQSIIYQTIGISLVHKNKHQTNQRCREKKYDLLVLDNIPSTRRRREFRIRVCFESGIWRFLDSDPVLVDGYNIRNCVHFLDEDKHIDTDRSKLIQFKLFLWPNYRLEDLACMNRYWFDTNNGSRFSMSRIRMYPQFRIS